MKKNVCKTIIVVITAVMLIGCCVPAMAEEEKDIDNMTIEELKIAYLELELEYERVKNQLDSLQNDTDEGELEEAVQDVVEEEIETEGEPVLMSADEFKNDIVESYNARGVISDRHTAAEKNTMTNDEHVEYYYECAEAERDFYNKYRNAIFEDLNIQYLCSQYIDGLTKQYYACETYFDTKDYSVYAEYWDSGYYDRAYVIVELEDYYELPFGNISEMREQTESMDSLNEAENRNAEIDAETVQKTQQLLNDIGFYCGNADGVSGKRTVKSIQRFQEMYGYEPIDGMIDDELIEQLEAELAKKEPTVGSEEETEAE